MARHGSEVVSAARSGDQAAWRELYTRHNPRLTLWLSSLPSADAAASAEDIAAEAWLTAAAKLSDYPGTDDDFVRWLFTIARNHAANTRRTAQRRRTDPVETLTGLGEATSDAAMAAVDGMDTTRQLLSRLSPREAEVVACIDVVGLDVTATARVLGMKPTAGRVARHRALGRLRTALAVTGPTVEPDATLTTTGNGCNEWVAPRHVPSSDRVVRSSAGQLGSALAAPTGAQMNTSTRTIAIVALVLVLIVRDPAVLIDDRSFSSPSSPSSVVDGSPTKDN